MPPSPRPCPRCQQPLAIPVGPPTGPITCAGCGAKINLAPATWHCAINGQKRGPLTLGQLQQLARGGQLKPTDMVQPNASAKWQPASGVASLWAAPASPPTPTAARPRPAPDAPRRRSKLPWILLSGCALMFVLLVSCGVGAYFFLPNLPSIAGTPTTPAASTDVAHGGLPAPTEPTPGSAVPPATTRMPVQPPAVPPPSLTKNAPKAEPAIDPLVLVPIPDRDPVVRTRPHGGPDTPTLTNVLVLTPKAGGPPVVLLEKPTESIQPKRRSFRGILAREIVRQALLVAARDELGLATRDQVLRETVGPLDRYDVKGRLVLSSYLEAGNPGKITLRAPGENGEVLWSKEVPFGPGPNFNYVTLLELAEAWSRADFVDALKKIGADGKPRGELGMEPVSEASEQHLEGLTFPRQFAALRSLHDDVNQKGESRFLRGGLVRAYANFGVLTEHLPVSSHKAAKARALLYAQRLVVREPQSPWGHWHRAYAAALAGLHQVSLNDLAAAARLPADKGQSPPWIPWIDAYCRCDSERLGQAAAAQGDTLPRLLQFLSVEDRESLARAFPVGRKILEENPECYRVLDGMCGLSAAGWNPLELTERGPALLGKTAAQRVAEMPRLPAAVAELAGKAREVDEPKLVNALIAAGLPERDAAEPAWGVLGWTIRETRYRQVAGRAFYLGGAAGADHLRAMQPWTSDHPLDAGFDLPNTQGDVRAQLLAKLRAGADPAEAEATQGVWYRNSYEGVLGTLHDVGPYHFGAQHVDHVHLDLAARLFALPQAERAASGHLLHLVSPFAARGRAALVESDWTFAAKHAADWEKAPAGQTIVLAALARRYGELKRAADAERCWKRCLAALPEQGHFRDAADFYEQGKQLAQAQQALEAALKAEAYGPEHLYTTITLANHFLRQKEYAKALPYAEAAAASGYEPAVSSALTASAGAKDPVRAEQWARRLADAGRPDAWYDWCLTTGQGDLKKAAAFTAERCLPIFDKLRQQEQRAVAHHYILQNQPKEAAQIFARMTAQWRVSEFFLHQALLTEEQGDKTLWKQARERIPAVVPLGQLTALLSDAAAGDGKLDPAAVDGALAREQPAYRDSGAYIAGRFLQLRGHQAEAAKFLTRCAQGDDPFLRALAKQALQGKAK